ncbi:uncharacterized protein [Haliotis cracherodii]|uniref:uncharacterized protein n=1 Tax=Haliotis cracherodii TaxID=6455 RepID=UPI0039E73C2F
MIVPTEGQVHQQRGGTLRLACAEVGRGDGADAPDFHWTDINYHVINNTKGRVHVTDMGSSSILVFSDIQDSDTGSYFCGGFSHDADVSDSVAVNVYDAFYVPDVDCGIMEIVHAAFQQCVGYYNITVMMFPVPQGDADIVINAANVFFTQEVPEMCRKRRQFSLAARCITAISAECLNRNRSKGWLDYFHTGNDVVDGMAVICEAYMSGSYNASCVSSVEDSLVRCINEEYETWLSQPVETHGVGKASNTMCRLYSASLDCAEKVLQVCKPKMTTVERFADAYKNMKPSQCATEDGKPGPVTDPWVCSDIGELHAKYRQCLVPGMYNVTLPSLITGSEMAYTIPALVVLQTSADTCSNKASLSAAVRCVTAISRNCVYHTWFNLIPVLPLQAEIDLAIQYKCVFIRAYNASCVAPKAPNMFETAWMKMAHDYNLSFQQNIQAMMCSFRKYVDVVAQTMMSDCGDEAVKTFLAVNNIVAPDNDRCQRFGHAVSIPYIVG